MTHKVTKQQLREKLQVLQQDERVSWCLTDCVEKLIDFLPEEEDAYFEEDTAKVEKCMEGGFKIIAMYDKK